MRRTASVEALVSLLLCGTLSPSQARQFETPQESVTQDQPNVQTFSGKIVSQNGVRFVLKDDDNNVWYHLDDQQKASKLFGKDVLITGTFDGLTGAIRVQSIVEATPQEKAAANAAKKESEAAKHAAPPLADADTVVPRPQQANPAQEPAAKMSTPRSEAQISSEIEVLPRPQGELSANPVREAPSPSFLSLPEEAVSASSSIAISSHRQIPMPPDFDLQTQLPIKHLVVGRLLKRVDPVYPLDAKQQRIEDTVRLHAVIDEDGKVQSLEPVSGPPLLVEAALIAVRQWRYGPTIFEGDRLPVQDDIRLVFRLPY